MVAILLTIVIATLMKCTNACGVSTHISIANQALESFADSGEYNVSYRDIILNNYDAFYAGSNYPDAMYSSACFGGRFHDISEDTHWTPFLNATANYIRKRYPQPWSKDTEKLIAFTFGVVSHQVADITWHSLGIDQGFLQTMANVNFYGSFSTAHPLGDAGGDMVSIFEGDLQDILLTQKWYFPVEDLVNIYKKLYGKIRIDENIIISCSSLLFAEWIGEKIAGADLFTLFADKSPFLVEKLHSYFLGGKSDMAAWSSIIWHEAAHLIEKGSAACEMPRNPLYIRCNPGKSLSLSDFNNKLQRRPRRISLIHFKNVNNADIKITPTSRGVYFDIKGETAEKLRAMERHPQTTLNEQKIFGKHYWTSKSLIFSTKIKYAELGWSLASGRLPGYGEVLITAAPWYGSPGNSQHGRVYILSTGKSFLDGNYTDIDQAANQILEGTATNSRFGYALTLLDYNADGVNDLAISAPSQGSNSLNYTGAVYIYYGNSTSGRVNTKPDVIILGDQRYFNLGTRLLGADVNMDGFDDLIIGSKYSPSGGAQRGSVIVFISRKRDEKKPQTLYSSQADLWLKGEQNYSWFGHDFAFQKKTSIGPTLIVSAPTFRICALKNCSYSKDDVQSAGKLYGYQMSGGEWKLKFQVIGETPLGQLGSSIAIGDPFGSGPDILAVSSPTSDVYGHRSLEVPSKFEQAGKVFLLSLEMLVERYHVRVPGTEYVSCFEGNLDFGRFGWRVLLQDVNNDGLSDLIVGSPYQTQNVYTPKGGEEGAVYIYYGGKKFPLGNATRDCDVLSTQPCPQEKASLYLDPNQRFSQFGREVVALSLATASGIVVSAPRQSVNSSLHNGAIYVFPISGKLRRGKLVY
ncbi:phosphatidylinositol-glycan-specific phospholipase D-like [Dendronephthya gigantea]|uniref:phosphatidylinositol-glycan-specific phospholipase D-like n=1 Tax=Dendronephthya gigantea TaxID=151771 RepID=UPI00106B496E|nr:phosphatidylinositol-glycan-specific phospholipase D-like [Dendronephthya gigantea]